MSRTQLIWTALFVGAAGLLAIFDALSPVAMVSLAALGLCYLVAYPATTFALLLLSLSCDQVLTLRSESGTIRLAHVCAAVLFARLAVQRLVHRQPWPVARPLAPALAFYFLAAFANLATSAAPAKSVGYMAWALFDAVALFSVVLEAASTRSGFSRTVKLWIAGAGLNAAFGLVQLALGLLHQKVPLVEQRLGDFPRINGFNYEPAYFALYLESVAAVLIARWAARPAQGKGGALLAAGLGLAAALSMSRSGWLGIGILGLVVLIRLAASARGAELLRVACVAGALLTAGALVLPAKFLAKAPEMAAMALNPHEASSTAPRLSLIDQARQVFTRRPLLGVGLGGYGGFIVQNPELKIPGLFSDQSKIVTTNVWLEILAETGTLGLFGVLWAIGATVLALMRAARHRAADASARAWASGFLLSVVLVFAVLYQFNQTLWRLDVWTLLALAWAAVGRVGAVQSEPGLEVELPSALEAA
jgi:O-antigen ligase